MSIAVDPAALAQASAAVSSAIAECETTIGQLTSAKASLDGSTSAAIAATNTALSGWTQGAGFAAFEGAQSRLRTHMNTVDGQIQTTIQVTQVLLASLTEYKAALGGSSGAFSETDAQIAASWAPVQ